MSQHPETSELDLADKSGRYYFSPAPHAEPQAAGLGSGFSSPAPQAEPHAPEGFSVSALAQR